MHAATPNVAPARICKASQCLRVHSILQPCTACICVRAAWQGPVSFFALQVGFDPRLPDWRMSRIWTPRRLPPGARTTHEVPVHSLHHNEGMGIGFILSGADWDPGGEAQTSPNPDFHTKYLRIRKDGFRRDVGARHRPPVCCACAGDGLPDRSQCKCETAARGLHTGSRGRKYPPLSETYFHALWN